MKRYVILFICTIIIVVQAQTLPVDKLSGAKIKGSITPIEGHGRDFILALNESQIYGILHHLGNSVIADNCPVFEMSSEKYEVILEYQNLDTVTISIFLEKYYFNDEDQEFYFNPTLTGYIRHLIITTLLYDFLE